jgi:hypothetical protein
MRGSRSDSPPHLANKFPGAIARRRIGRRMSRDKEMLRLVRFVRATAFVGLALGPSDAPGADCRGTTRSKSASISVGRASTSSRCASALRLPALLHRAAFTQMIYAPLAGSLVRSCRLWSRLWCGTRHPVRACRRRADRRLLAGARHRKAIVLRRPRRASPCTRHCCLSIDIALSAVRSPTRPNSDTPSVHHCCRRRMLARVDSVAAQIRQACETAACSPDDGRTSGWRSSHGGTVSVPWR